jgi:hypothetical protein
MVASGLARVGFQYVNLDDFYYVCPGPQGPDVDGFGRWVTDTAKFPPDGATDGIQVVANHVHGKGLKFGLYVTPGISKQAVAKNTPIEGTPYHAADIATTTVENNYNCKGMVGIDYTRPGAQEFVDSWANLFASWGVDYLKIDGVGLADIPDIQAWSAALRQTGRPIHLELSNNLNISGAATWKQYANGWRTSGDIECYSCEPAGGSYPLTTWSRVQGRFSQVANWQPYAGPGGWNDYDSLEVGNGANTGLTLAERRAHMSLWALGAAPLILGTDLTSLDPVDLELLKNRDVLAVDQDAIAAARVANSGGRQVFTKKEPNGDVVVGLFNTADSAQVVSATTADLGLPAADAYLLFDLWTHLPQETASLVSATVPAHGVALYRVRSTRLAKFLPPDTTLDVSGLAAGGPAGPPLTATLSFTDNGVQPVQQVRLGLAAPAGWTVTPTSPVRFDTVAAGQTVSSTFQVVPAPPAALFPADVVTASADYLWYGFIPLRVTSGQTVTTSRPVQPPWRTFASTPSVFAQDGTRLGVQAGGGDVFGATNAYGAIYQAGGFADGTVATVRVTSQANTNDTAKAGIMVRNDITNAGAARGFVTLLVTPGRGYQLQWDSDGDGRLDGTAKTSNATAAYPSWLRLVRSGTMFTGYYSTDGSTWTSIGTATVPSAAATQDVGLFATSHNTSMVGQAEFDHFTIASSA